MVRLLGYARAEQLLLRYSAVLAKVMPWDTDGDGVSDGLEWFYATGHNNPTSTPDRLRMPEPVEAPEIVWYSGERKTLRWVLRDRPRIGYQKSFRATIAADTPVLLATGKNGPPGKGPITLAPNSLGELEFDVLSDHPVLDVGFTFTIPANGFSNTFLYDFQGHRLPRETAVYFSDPQGRPINYPDDNLKMPLTDVCLAWASLEGVKGYMIERKRKVPRAEWKPYGTRAITDEDPAQPVVFLIGLFTSLADVPADFDYRVVPVDSIIRN
jgi:hypothetical protein